MPSPCSTHPQEALTPRQQEILDFILDGDLLAVHRTAEARSGQIVVARLEDEVTVKRLQRRGSRVELKSFCGSSRNSVGESA